MSQVSIKSRHWLVNQVSDILGKKVIYSEGISERGKTSARKLLSKIIGNNEVKRLDEICEEFSESSYKNSVKGEGIKYSKVPELFNANRNGYKLIRFIIDSENIPKSEVLHSEDILTSASDINMLREPMSVWNIESEDRYRMLLKNNTQFSDLQNKKYYLEESIDKNSKEYQKQSEKHEEMLDFSNFGVSKNRPVTVYQIHGIVIIVFGNKHRKRAMSFFGKPYVIIHYGTFTQSMTLLSDFAWTYIKTSSMSCEMSSQHAAKILINAVVDTGINCPETVGGVLKGAKQLAFLDQDSVNLLGKSAYDYYLETLDGDKEKYSELIYGRVSAALTNPLDVINSLNIFRCVLHPDIDVRESFNQVSGFKEPNSFEKKELMRLKGECMKKIYINLLKQDMDPRLAIDFDTLGDDPPDEATLALVRLSLASSTPISVVDRYGWTTWSRTKFIRCQRLFDGSDVTIKASNKSTAMRKEITASDLNNFKGDGGINGYQEVKDKFRSTNDLADKVKDKDQVTYEEAKFDFDQIVKSFEGFEATMKEKGYDMDDIPCDEISNFLENHKENILIVLTEPKIFEVHKENSRIFYMATRFIKILQQTAERLAKQVGSRDEGISITKSYKARRRELEEFSHAYTGPNSQFKVQDDYDNASNAHDIEIVNLWNAFLSFDMSEFSKKFPAAPTRIIGSIFADLTGEEWLRRIDIIFKASMVIHNTRSYVGFMTGVKGGFEGFFNFIWSIYHSVVMDIAVRTTGLQGVGVVYSDDGIAKITYGRRAAPMRDVLRIQRVFMDYGLSFNIGKLAFTSEIWEYLGEMCIKGMIMDQPDKAFYRMGRTSRSSGYNSFDSVIQDYVAQGEACINAGGNHTLVGLKCHYFFLEKLRRATPNVPCNSLKFLSIIPQAAGGFRFRTPYEMASKSRITGFSEFLADLELVGRNHPEIVRLICIRIMKNLMDESEYKLAVIGGNMLQTDIQNSSNPFIINKLIEKASSKFDDGLAVNPYDDDFKAGVLDYLKASGRISLSEINTVLKNTPSYLQYTESIALVRSTALLTLVPKGFIKKNQAYDSKLSRKRIMEWHRHFYHEQNSRLTTGIDVYEMIRDLRIAVDDRLHPLNLIPEKESGRVALVRSGLNESDIRVNYRFEPNVPIYKSIYTEPVKKFLDDAYTSDYYTENTHDSLARRMRKFVIYATHMASSSPKVIYFVAKILDMLGLPPIKVSASLSSSFHRVASKNSLGTLVDVIIPQPFLSNTDSSITYQLFADHEFVSRSDRTTYTILAKLNHGLSLQHSHEISSPADKDYLQSYYQVRDQHINMVNQESDYKAYVTTNRVNSKQSAVVTRIMTESIIETEQRINLIDSLLEDQALRSNEKEVGKALVLAILVDKFSKFLWPIASRKAIPSDFRVTVPIFYKADVVLETIANVSFQVSSKLSRNRLSDFIIKHKDDFKWHMMMNRRTDSSVTSMLTNDSIDEYIALIGKVDDFRITVNALRDTVRNLEMGAGVHELLGQNILTEPRFVKSLFRSILRKCLDQRIDLPNVVIKQSHQNASMMTSTFKKSVKDGINFAIRECLVKSSEAFNKGERDLMVDDTFVDMMTIASDILRVSKHRDSAYNHDRAVIEAIKMYHAVKFAVVDCEGIEEMVEFDSMSAKEINEVMSLFKSERPDLREMLEAGLAQVCVTRAKKLARFMEKDPALNQFMNWAFKMLKEDIAKLYEHLLTYSRSVWNTVVSKVYSSINVYDQNACDAVSSLVLMAPSKMASAISVDRVERDLDKEVIESLNGIGVNPREIFSGNLNKLRMALNLIAGIHHADWADYQFNPNIPQILAESHSVGQVETSLDDNHYYLHAYKYFDPDDAIDNFIKRSKISGFTGIMLRRVVKHEINERFKWEYFILMFGPAVNTVESADEARLIDWADQEVRDLYSGLFYESEDDAIDSLGSIYQHNVKAGQDTLPTDGFESLVSMRSFGVSRGELSQCVNDDPFIVALNEYSHGLNANQNAARVYIGVYAWMKYGFRPSARELIRSLQELSRYKKSSENLLSLNNDISLTWDWLKRSGLFAGTEIDSQSVFNMTHNIGQLPNILDVFPTATMAGINTLGTIKAIIRKVGGHKVKIGKLSEILYIKINPAHPNDDDYELMSGDELMEKLHMREYEE